MNKTDKMKQIHTKKIELLSPAKNLECGLAAINNGADAVYIGGPGFGARKNAGNSLEDIAQLIEHAHLFHAKVYITLNTLLFDNELETANKLVHDVYKLGADAIIIQDVGLLETDLPPIPIHASTQTDNRTADKVKFWEDLGLDQVVLARELSLEQIKTIRNETTVPLEYFIHGALCVCYSGQCYMSQAINRRSANRGECGQPCRLKYSLKDGNGEALQKNKHLLSLKDLNLSEHLEELIDAGIQSFKIEGRLKDKDYVANITAFYRKKLDDIIARRQDVVKASDGESMHAFEPNAAKSFNRGFTTYFFNGREKGIWSIDSPKSLGEKIGRVTKVGKDFFTIDSSVKINNGDGLCYFTKNKELTGLKVNQVEGNKIKPNQMGQIRSGFNIYRNYDHAFTMQAVKSNSQRKIAVDVLFKETNQGFELSFTDASGLQSSILNTELSPDKASNPERAFEQIKTQISKLGNSAFHPASVNVELNDNYFFAAKDLNALRRQLIEMHEQKRLLQHPKKELHLNEDPIPFIKDELDFRANITNQKAADFYKKHGVKKLEWGFEKQVPGKDAELMRTKHCLLYLTNRCLKDHPEAKALLPLTMYNDKDGYLLKFDCKNCEMVVKKKSKAKKHH